MKQFFFDTANITHIQSTWEYLKKNNVDSKLVEGITTNPNAFFKVEKHRLHEQFEHMPRLCETVSNIRNDNKGVVYVQGPSSKMTSDEILFFAEKVAKLTDGNTRIGLKIGPFTNILNVADKLNQIVDINVTGVSDCATALKAMSYNISYMSIIPGRMEEVGIDAKEQVAFINSSANPNRCRVITGSMRTLQQVVWTFQYNTTPTIGERVWNTIIEEDVIDQLINIDYTIEIPRKEYAPFIDEKNYNLTREFFKQMDECGTKAYSNFKELIFIPEEGKTL
jgi:transaldolase